MVSNFISKFGKKVMLLDSSKNKYDTSILYRISCDCGSKDCDIELELELDNDLKMMNLNFYKKIYFLSYLNYYYCTDDDNRFLKIIKLIISIIKVIFKRIGAGIKLLFTGRLEMEGCLILKDSDHINSFIEALEEGKKFCLEEENKK